MASLEHDLRNCIFAFDSNSISERKKSMDRLRELVNDRRIIQLLNRNSLSGAADGIDWTYLLNAVHRLLIQESEKIKQEEAKGSMTAPVKNRRATWKNDCSSLAAIIVNKANQDIPKIKCSALLGCILEILDNDYYRENYGVRFIEILRSRVMPFRKYWSDMSSELWMSLLETFLRILKTPPPQAEYSAVVEVLNRIVIHGTENSQLGLKLKSKFPVIAEAFNDPRFYNTTSCHEWLLHLLFSMCLQLARESRMACCHFGENVLVPVIHLYDKMSKEKKDIVFNFLLLQMHLHHPLGATSSEGAAYAFNWDQWQHKLNSLYALIESKINKMHEIKSDFYRETSLHPVFLQFAVEVCKQVFFNNCSALDVTVMVTNEEASATPSPKRRRVLVGIQAVMDTIRTCWVHLITQASAAAHEYAAQYPQRCHPDKNVFHCLEQRLWETGILHPQVVDRGHPRTRRTPQTEDDILEAILQSPQRSTRDIARQFQNRDSVVDVWLCTELILGRGNRRPSIQFQLQRNLRRYTNLCGSPEGLKTSMKCVNKVRDALRKEDRIRLVLDHFKIFDVRAGRQWSSYMCDYARKPMLSLLSALMLKYPESVKEVDFIPLLQMLVELLTACKDTLVMDHLCLCCISIMKVEKNLIANTLDEQTVDPLWEKIWEITLRTVGLNQSEKNSHHLLQELITHNKAVRPVELVHMYISGTIRLSVPSLQTLNLLLMRCDLPDKLVPWTSSDVKVVRLALLDWLLPDRTVSTCSEQTSLLSQNVDLEPSLLAKVLIQLILKSQFPDISSSAEHKSSRLCSLDSSVYEIEQDYVLSCFEGGLLVPHTNRTVPGKAVSTPRTLLNMCIRDKLIELLIRDCYFFLQCISEDGTRFPEVINEIILLLEIWSWMLKLNILPCNSRPSFAENLRNILGHVSVYIVGVIENIRHKSYLSTANILVNKLKELFMPSYHKTVSIALREMISQELLLGLFKMAKTRLTAEEDAGDDDVDLGMSFSQKTERTGVHHTNKCSTRVDDITVTNDLRRGERVRNVKAIPSECLDSNYKLLVADLTGIQVQKTMTRKRIPSIKDWRLQEEDCKHKFQEMIKSKLPMSESSCNDVEWNNFKTSFISRAKEVCRRTSMQVMNERMIVKEAIEKQNKANKLDDLDQYGRKNSIEIHGIPEMKTEDTLELVKVLGQALDIEVNNIMIDACHRLKRQPHQSTAGIIVKFVRRTDRENFIRRRKVKRNLNASQLGFPSNGIIYINQNLTPYREKILGQARRLKNEKNYAYLWVDPPGNIKLRKREEDQYVYNLKTLEDVSYLTLTRRRSLSDMQKLQLDAAKVLCYFCCGSGSEDVVIVDNLLTKLLELFLSGSFDLDDFSDFNMAVEVLECILCASNLKQHHVSSLLRVLQAMCRAWYKDAEGVSIILKLLQGTLVHVHRSGEALDKENSLRLMKGMMKNLNNKKPGPKVFSSFIDCLSELAKVDPAASWSTWDCGTLSVGDAPAVEEILVYLKSPFHEVRMAVVKNVCALFLSSTNLQWQSSLFDKLHTIVMDSFVVEGELTEEDANDEGANRAASALHALAVLVVISPYLRKRALFGIFQLVKEKNLRVELVYKVLVLIGESLNLQSTEKFMGTNLNYLLTRWFQKNHKLQEFPWLLLNCKSEVDFYYHYKEEIVPILLQRDDDETLLLVCQRLGCQVNTVLEPSVRRGYNPDLISVSDAISQQCVKSVCKPIPNTQHRPIMCQVFLTVHPQSVPFRRRYNFKKADWLKYTKRLDEMVADIERVPEDCYPRIMARLVPCFSFGGAGDVDGVLQQDVKAAKLVYTKLESILTEGQIKALLRQHLDVLVVEVMHLVYDPTHFSKLCGSEEVMPQPDLPFFTANVAVKSLEYLQKTSPAPDIPLMVFLSKKLPACIQRMLLQLALAIHSAPTCEDRLLAFYQYSTFTYILGSELERDGLGSLAHFIIRDVVHMLLHIMESSYKNNETSLTAAVCHFLGQFSKQCLAVCAHIVAKFLTVTCSALVPLVKSEDTHLSSEALALLKFFIIDNSEKLSSAIKLLDPFPENPVFDALRVVCQQIKYDKGDFSLEDEISHFLNSENVNLGCRTEGLQHIRIQLSQRKKELKIMYNDLKSIRGFSEDCANSILHQLICTLVELASHSDPGMRQEAARCLGELGPADLTTTVLRPESKRGLPENDTPVDLLVFAGHVLRLLTNYLVDEDIKVVEAASKALYVVLASKEGQTAIETSLSKPNQEYLVPFLSTKKSKQNSSAGIDEKLFKMQVDCPELWCPEYDCSHESWITKLVCSILETFPKDNCFLPNLISMCKVKVSFSENILPLLVTLVLKNGSDNCNATVWRHIQYFFHQHFNNYRTSAAASLKKSEKICLNRASVQCMLDIVHCVWLQNKSGERYETALDLNFLHVAQAAQFCSAYFTSILYTELWCGAQLRYESYVKETFCKNTSPLEYVCDKNPEDGIVVQNILREAYMKIGDSDAVYGCGSSHLLNPRTRIHQYELVGKWEKVWNQVMLAYDVELASGNMDATRGLLGALQKCSLHHVLNGYIKSLDPKVKCNQQDYEFECTWRLAQWDTTVTTTCNKQELRTSFFGREFEKCRFESLKAIHESDTTALEEALANARSCVIESLTHASLESSKNLYKPLSHLQAIQEIEDFANIDMKSVLEKWRLQDEISFNEFEFIEHILWQRTVLLSLAEAGKGEKIQKAMEVLANLHLDIAILARNEGCHQVAARSHAAVTQIVEHVPNIAVRLKLEEACLSWERGDKEVGKYLLRSLLSSFSSAGIISDDDLKIYSTSLKLYGDWMAETKSENARIILNNYYLKAIRIMENASGGKSSHEHLLDTYFSLARFADAEYQQLVRYMKSSVYEMKKKWIGKARKDAMQLKQQPSMTKDDKRAVVLMEKQSHIDMAEIENTEKERDMYLTHALTYYLHGLIYGDKNNLQVFRVASLWLDNMFHEELNKILESNLTRVPSHKFVPLLPQLTPRMSNVEDTFVVKLNGLLERCAIDHPHHTLPLILALANSYKDRDYISAACSSQNDRTQEPRVLGAQLMVRKLLSKPAVGPLLKKMEQVSIALISLAYLQVKNTKAESHKVPESEPISKLRDLNSVLIPTLSIPVKVNCQYDNIIGIHKFQSTFTLVGGINVPKKIQCIGTDGIARPQLVKGQDDLRQDAVMQQVFTIINMFLKNNKDTSKRKLVIRTYKVVPLSQRSGIIEWCQNTQPLSAYLTGEDQKMGAHRKYYPQDLPPHKCREKFRSVATKPNDKKLEVFQEICTSLHPVFHYFFLEKFPTPGVWYERRLAYIHSVATSSMIGYILGIGDRHTLNILIDNTTAEVIHIDFGIAFEMGLILPTPETVPFRLTRDIVDGMGVCGIEGVFRRSCEKTLTVLRQNQATILTILEVLLYDPLYAWTITPNKAYNLQRSGSEEELADEEDSSVEVNKMAERALLRLQQKLQGVELETVTSVADQVDHLLHQASDPGNLSRLYFGWQPYL
ncbi:serine-protein kinase ATM [Anabrus simplex]|uniref:serine-protein kinase ATM n=1 Tax=Anabrus simplex TaxID=316456 RepID=UPI0035A37268